MDRAALIRAMQATAAAKPVPFDHPKWGTVYVRQVTVADIDAQETDTADAEDKHRIARAACRVLCDEDGRRLFDPANAEDVELMAAQPWQELKAVLSAGEKPGNV